MVVVMEKIVKYNLKLPSEKRINDFSVNGIIENLSENMDILLDQMLKTQEKILDANTIVITKKLKKDIEYSRAVRQP